MKLNIAQMVVRHVDMRNRAGFFSGPCPFHDDQGFSLTISLEGNTFLCSHCGAMGGPEDFLRMIGEKNANKE